MATAAILVIGGEILNGRVRDENSPWLAEQLRTLGVDLHCIMVLPDDVDVLAPQIRELSASHDHLFTSGGLGPTHDDQTMKAVAQAFGERLTLHEELSAELSERLQLQPGTDRRHAAMIDMCRLPTSARISRHPDLFFPLVRVHNVVILPGVPHLFRRKFMAFRDEFMGVPMLTRQLVTPAGEPSFAAELSEIQQRWPAVTIGSYPERRDDGWQTTVTLESRDEEALEQCHALVTELLIRAGAGDS